MGWENKEKGRDETKESEDPFDSTFHINEYNKRLDVVTKFVESATDEEVRTFLASILADNEKWLYHFYNIVNRRLEIKDTKKYIIQIERIVHHYLGRENFISYYEADDFIMELRAVLDEDVRQMIDSGNYLDAFEVMNYIFVVIEKVDMNASDEGIITLADRIYDYWIELINEVDKEEKMKMFHWFTSYLKCSVMDDLEEYVERIVLEEFKETEYEQVKLDFMEKMIKKVEKEDDERSGGYYVKKWVLLYLELLEGKKESKQQIEEVCKKYWKNCWIREYYIDKCMEQKEYDKALEVLEESIVLDKQAESLVAKYSLKKKKIYFLQGNTRAYIEELWKLVLEYRAGNLELYKELKGQYSEKEWIIEREKILNKFLANRTYIEMLYAEEKMYDKLLLCVLASPDINELQKYDGVLKEEYPEQILNKYKNEVENMVMRASNREQYSYMVSLLSRMQEIEGGKKIVEELVKEWKIKYKKRRSMMNELKKL